MSANCFVCLNKAKNKVCTICECYAHSQCWGEYLKHSTDIFTFVYYDEVIISMPMSTICPICQGKIKNIKPITRSDTKLGRKLALITGYRGALHIIDQAENDSEKIDILTNLFEAFRHHRSLIDDDPILKILLRQKLEFLHFYSGWQSANLYHRFLFGEYIDEKSF